ncbi:hypothetical protein B0H63DRAFT_529012 [Podospora didyma]|uniref:Integral membrane protein n=1 Tax=Podospora didyma TaxID=330526 RepID=A0AAE0K2Y2_9PEZI|nr:hypothetical protein B0H63DRAFT_529012 [Podospora didyma]
MGTSEQPNPGSPPPRVERRRKDGVGDCPSWDGTEHDQGQRPPMLPLDECTKLVFRYDRGRFSPKWRSNYRNSLLATVGFIEAANAGDFAANVWNMTPLPIYAIVFMALGGTLALVMLYFVIKDAILSWRNLCGLRDERRLLWKWRSENGHSRLAVRTVDCLLQVNFRDMGAEAIDRLGMDALMGFGALVVGVGTYMAIDGGKPAIFLASNLLTGYIGNSPCAAYGLVNLVWSAYAFIRSRRHKAAMAPGIKGTRIEQMLKIRTANIQLHSSLNGITGIVAGAASLATATQWPAYVVLCPCIVTSGLVNYLWRHRVGYDRPFIYHDAIVNEQNLLSCLHYADSCRRKIEGSSSDPVDALITDPSSLTAVLEFIHRNNLVEYFCMRFLEDADLIAEMYPSPPDHGPHIPLSMITIDLEHLNAQKDNDWGRRILEIAKAVINERALRCFKYQERWLLETLGCHMAIVNSENSENTPERKGSIEIRATQPRNVYTTENEWEAFESFESFEARLNTLANHCGLTEDMKDRAWERIWNLLRQREIDGGWEHHEVACPHCLEVHQFNKLTGCLWSQYTLDPAVVSLPRGLSYNYVRCWVQLLSYDYVMDELP